MSNDRSRLVKCLNLAADPSTTKGERDSAVAAARRIMDKIKSSNPMNKSGKSYPWEWDKAGK